MADPVAWWMKEDKKSGVHGDNTVTGSKTFCLTPTTFETQLLIEQMQAIHQLPCNCAGIVGRHSAAAVMHLGIRDNRSRRL